MDKETVEKTKKTAALYFKDVTGEKPYDLWKSFDKEIANDLSLFITGKMYAREKLPHKTRQLITVAALTALSKTEELKLHIQAGLNVGCTAEDIAEVIFQTMIYAGVPAGNSALKALREVINQKKP
ncbi:MAG: carboxymuconolactone decarboxylase family protein [Deltaproteobacteria bacterium]|nr:carboxymuconolactone decarboxylase family protein [Deltaproteobacteria bacterium]